MAVRILVDSTADIPHERAQQLGIEVVPLIVLFGDRIAAAQLRRRAAPQLEALDFVFPAHAITPKLPVRRWVATIASQRRTRSSSSPIMSTIHSRT